MRHTIIAESERTCEKLLVKMSDDGFFKGIARTARNYFVLTISGREDVITIISREDQSRGVRFDGRILRQNNNSSIDELYYYVMRANRPYRTKGMTDAETSRWHWTEEDTYGCSPRHEPAFLRTLADELQTEEWSRQRR